jgi:hypothetical protein
LTGAGTRTAARLLYSLRFSIGGVLETVCVLSGLGVQSTMSATTTIAAKPIAAKMDPLRLRPPLPRASRGDFCSGMGSSFDVKVEQVAPVTVP